MEQHQFKQDRCPHCGIPTSFHPYLKIENLPLNPEKLREKIREDFPDIPINSAIDIIIWFNNIFPYRRKDFKKSGMYYYLENCKEKKWKI